MASFSPQNTKASVGLIINPTAGKGVGQKVGLQLVELLEASDVAVNDLSSHDAESAAVKARRAIADKQIQALFVVGGDGTAQLGVNLCANTDVALAIVSAGTGNDSARALGLHSLALPNLVARLLATLDSPRSVDLLRCQSDGETFWSFGSVSAGFDALVNARANRMTWPKGPSRYTVAMLIELASFKPISYRAKIDSQPREFEAMLCVGANAQSFGGGMLIVPHAEINDGYFDLLILHKISRPELIKVFPKVFEGKHVDHPAVEFVRCRELEIEAVSATHGHMPCFADGESKGRSPLKISLAPKTLKVLG